MENIHTIHYVGHPRRDSKKNDRSTVCLTLWCTLAGHLELNAKCGESFLPQPLPLACGEPIEPVAQLCFGHLAAVT